MTLQHFLLTKLKVNFLSVVYRQILYKIEGVFLFTSNVHEAVFQLFVNKEMHCKHNSLVENQISKINLET